MKVGFIGAGIMGRPMVLNLKAAGHELFVPERASLSSDIRAIATVLDNPASVATHADVVILMVADTPDVEAVLFGARGVADGLRKGMLVIDMSSISPTATKKYAARILEAGGEWLDAPVSGGEVGAKEATLTIMVGGSRAAFDRAKPLFEKLGKNITHVGEEPGSGQVCKVCNQIIVALNIQAVAEALTFARKAGVDAGKVRQALMGGFAASRILEVHAVRMLNRSFDPGFRIKLHQKDLNLALSSARDLGMALPNTAIAQQLFSVVTAMGGAEQDHSAMVRAIEAMAAVES